jgi:hypothetical protein
MGVKSVLKNVLSGLCGEKVMVSNQAVRRKATGIRRVGNEIFSLRLN